MHKTYNGARHGDLSFHPIKELPKGLKEVQHKGSFVLAEGEHTGHKHVVTSEKMKIFQDASGRYVLQFGSPAKIAHEEHTTITLQPGIYVQEIEQERDPFLDRIKEVLD